MIPGGTIMTRLFAVFVLIICSVLPLKAQEVAPGDRVAIENTISQQLQAFAAENGAAAFEFAAPIIKQSFGTPENFMAMVKRGYEPVYRNKSHQFGALEISQLGPAQHVTLLSADGRQYEAVYTMQLQPDGTWKISGCYLKEVPGVGA
jgi:hypothetical protein